AETNAHGGSAPELTIYQGFAALFAGNLGSARDAFERAGPAAAAVKLPAARIEAMVGLSLSLNEESSSESVALARRAFRMARTEALPQHEVFSALVLARARRHAHAPHLAGRILRSIADLAPIPWQGWIGWEGVLAGAAFRLMPATPIGQATGYLTAMLAAAVTGDRSAFDRSYASAADRVSEADLFRRELDDVAGALDVLRRAGPRLEAWRRSDTAQVPRGLYHLNAGQMPEPAVAYLVDRDDGSVRVLSAGLGLADPATRIAPESRPRTRTASAIGWLLRHRRAIHEEEFFRHLYGFNFAADAHRAVLDTLLYRVRSTLGDAATLRREASMLSLELHQSLAVWDPACASPLEDRLLALLARRGPSNPDEAAQDLGYSRRAVLDALKLLVEEGACRREKDGRKVRYEVEDTAFSDPTRTRFELAKRLDPHPDPPPTP
ncbi:MAG: helix-turn-helix transcriptional regulator, partial [Myxococcota bacterium]